jgi:uncharacterized protein YggE
MRRAIFGLCAAVALVSAACGEGKVTKPSTADGEAGEQVTHGGSIDGVSVISRQSGGGVSVTAFAPAIALGAAVPGAPSPGLTARGSATAMVPADDALVVVPLLGNFFAGPGGRTISDKDRAEVETALVALGLKRDEIRFETDQNFGPFPTISARIPAAQAKTLGPRIKQAVEDVLGDSSSAGVRFALTRCDEPLAALRKQAFEAAEARVKTLAAASGQTVGPVIAVSEGNSALSLYGGLADPCVSVLSAPFTGRPPATVPFDSEPLTRVSIELTVTHAIASGQEGAGLTVSGTGSVTAKADEAYVVWVGQQGFSSNEGPAQLDTEEREEILTKLKALGIAEDDVQFAGGGFGSPIVVSVELPLTGLAKQADAVLEVIEDALGSTPQSKGVRFSHSRCESVLAEARSLAAADIQRRAASMAQAASVKLGGLRSIGDAPVQAFNAPVALEPCVTDAEVISLTGGYNVGLKPADAEPVFRVDAGLIGVYAVTQ